MFPRIYVYDPELQEIVSKIRNTQAKKLHWINLIEVGVYTGPSAAMDVINKFDLVNMVEDQLMISVHEDTLVTQSFMRAFLTQTRCIKLVIIGGSIENKKEASNGEYYYNYITFDDNKELSWWEKLLNRSIKYKTIDWIKDETCLTK